MVKINDIDVEEKLIFKRKIYDQIMDWNSSPVQNSALLIEGARRIGKSTIMVIATTNKPWAIDSAFMRPGRFDEKIYIPLPDMVARKKLFELQLGKLPTAEDLDYDYLAKITEGFNGADIKEFCEKLKMSAIKDSISKGEEQTIGMDDVERVENTIKSSVSNEDIGQLKAFEEGVK